MLDSSLLPLQDSRSRIRPMRPDDAAAYVEGTRDEAVRRYAHLPLEHYTVDLVHDLIAGTIQDGLDRGDLAVLAIADVRRDGFAGSVVLFDVSAEGAEIGFWMHPAARGSGLAASALDLAADFARDSGIPTLTARTAPDNLASKRVLARASFTEIGDEVGEAPSGQRVALTRFERKLNGRAVLASPPAR